MISVSNFGGGPQEEGLLVGEKNRGGVVHHLYLTADKDIQLIGPITPHCLLETLKTKIELLFFYSLLIAAHSLLCDQSVNGA